MSETQVTTEAQFENTDDLDAFSDGFFGQKPDVKEIPPKDVPDKNVTTNKEDAEQDTSEDTEAQDADDEQDEAEAQEEIPDKPKRKTVQDRIDEVVRQREELRRESQAELAKLRQEIEDFKKSSTPAPVVADQAEPSPDAVDKDGEPIYALGEFDPQYIRDLTRFTLNQERAKVQAEMAESQKADAVKQEQQALTTQWNEKVITATEEYPDFVEKGQTLLGNFNDLPPQYAEYLTSVLMSMEKGTDVLYYLSNHPEEAAAIVNSGAQKATLALGRIESRFIKDEEEAPKKKFTKAPPPPQERTRGSNGAFIAVAPDTDNLDDFEAAFFAKAKK